MPDGNEYQYVKLPDNSYGRFPAGWKDVQIKAAIGRAYPGTYPPVQKAGTYPRPAPMTPSQLKEATRAPGSLFQDIGRTAWEEVKGLGSVLNPVEAAKAIVQMAGDPTGKKTAASLAEWKKIEWPRIKEEIKADPYTWALKHAPRAIGQAAGMAIAGKAIPEIPGALGKAGEAVGASRAGTAAARITERLAPMVEGEPTAAVVERTLPKLGLKGTEPLADVHKAVRAASANVTATENGLLARRVAGVPISETPVSGRSIAAELRRGIDPNMQDFDPRLAKAVAKRADVYESANLTVGRLQSRLRSLNEKLEGFYAKPDVQAALATHDPAVAILKQEANAVRNAYYDNLANLSGEDVRPLKQFQSDLIAMQRVVGKAAASEAKAAAEARAHPILGPKDSLRRKMIRGAAYGIGGTLGAGSIYGIGRKLLP